MFPFIDAIARVRRVGFEQALEAFAALSAAQIEGRELRAPLHARNLESFADYAELARRLGATQVRIEAALDAVTLDRLEAAAQAVERLAERCRVLGVRLEVSTLESGTGRFEWTPV
ncbi:MAG: hypothetical protein HC927_09205 [Deltaproteobacteria bacterium]|nr:hypothetical protein [Deltaproteobacteria bacterium]